jgi:Protein of unknown function (DUF5661)
LNQINITYFTRIKMKSFKTHLSEAPLNKKTPTAAEIAKKHKIPLSKVKSQIKSGSKVEHEHTKDQKAAEEIARDHIGEFPKYYPALKKMEGKLKKHG